MAEDRKFAGVVGIVLDVDGDVVASASDFNRSGMGGCSLEEAQTYRVRDQLKREFFYVMASPRFQKGISGYFVEQFWRMAEENGFKITTIPVRPVKAAAKTLNQGEGNGPAHD